MEDVTLAIAIWGAVTGTVATVGGLIALLRDRPKLEAGQPLEVTRAGEDSTVRVVLHVVNNGRQPLTVFNAGFSTQWESQGRWPRRRLVPASYNADVKGPDFPKRLAPGEPLTVILDLIRRSYIYMPDTMPQGFAMDTRQNLVKAKPHIPDETLKRVYDELDWSRRKPQRRPKDEGSTKATQGPETVAKHEPSADTKRTD